MMSEEVRKIKCRFCGGSGYCRSCRGTGKIIDITQTLVTCPACNGGRLCSHCEGHGFTVIRRIKPK